jgi:hypothetical protein
MRPAAEAPMKRREFLKSMTALAAGGLVSAPAICSAAKAQSRQETLLIVSESGPNNLDIHGVGTNVPGYEVSWNCYDRLISHEMKTGPNGAPYYDRDKFKMELADDMNVGDMSVTFKLKKNATFQDGTPVTAKDVKWSFDRAVSVGGFPTFQMGAGLHEFRRQRRQHRGASHAGDRCDRENRKRCRRQDELGKRGTKHFNIAVDETVDQIEAGDAVRRGIENIQATERRRRPAEQKVEHIDEQQPGEEHRERHAMVAITRQA